MAELQSRIEHFRRMASEDPENELAHFALGRAYLEAGMYEEAACLFRRVLELNPQMSRAYQLLATVLLKSGQRELAIEQLRRGVQVAHGRGDLIPESQMMQMLRDLGSPLPELKPFEPARTVGRQEVFCQRCGQVGTRLGSAPFRGELGQLVLDRTCEACWQQWLAMGTKVINELRLNLVDPAARQVYDQHMREFLNLGD